MKAVVLAGGKGVRLAPHTRILPKPLMPIGDMPILEIMLRQMKRFGVEEVILSVGHLAGLLWAFFQHGERYGLPIVYSFEESSLGTAGPLSLVSDRLDETFLVTNGDVLTTLNFASLVESHRASGAIATIAMKSRKVNIDLGVLQVNQEFKLTGYIEKPTYEFLASMGVYVFEPDVLSYIPDNEYLDFPDLIAKLLEDNQYVAGFPFDGYWQDLGRASDYEQAVAEFSTIRHQILTDELPQPQNGRPVRNKRLPSLPGQSTPNSLPGKALGKMARLPKNSTNTNTRENHDELASTVI